MLHGRGGIDLLERDTERAVEVRRPQEGEHVVLVDRLALLVREEGGLEARPRVELDLAVLKARVHVEEDDQAVVEAGPPDAPLVHQGACLRLGLLGRRVFAAVLGVDDHLGAGPRFDGVDRRLGLGDRRGRQDAGVVVDRPAVDGVGEWRTGRRRGGGGGIRHSRQQQDE